MRQSMRAALTIKRYLASMKCKDCQGKGCRKCNNTGDSKKFRDLLTAATTGIKS